MEVKNKIAIKEKNNALNLKPHEAFVFSLSFTKISSPETFP